MEDIPDGAPLRPGFFVVGDEFRHHGRAELQRAAAFVVDGGPVEGLEEVGELFRAGGLGAGPEVGHSGEHGLDLVGTGAVGPAYFEVADRLLDGGAAGAELLDAPGGEGDDGVAGILVLLQPQRVAVDGAVEVL